MRMQVNQNAQDSWQSLARSSALGMQGEPTSSSSSSQSSQPSSATMAALFSFGPATAEYLAHQYSGSVQLNTN